MIESLRDAARRLSPPVLLAMLVLGFASGLPLMMLYSKLSFRLAEAGIDRSTIGFMYWITLAYSIKWMWAPVVDRVKLPLLGELGRRRSWMLLAIIGTVAGLAVIAFSDPATQLSLTLFGAALLAYSGATLDISVDAWRIESAPNDVQSAMAALYQWGYRFAIMFAGLGLVVADYADWTISYLLMAATMGIIGAMVLFMREPPGVSVERMTSGSFRRDAINAVREPFLQFWERLGKWLLPVLALVAIYRLSDFTMGVMTSPFYESMGYSKSTVGFVTGVLAPWVTLVGVAVAAGVALALGVLRTLALGAVLTVLTNAAFAWLAAVGEPDVVMLTLVVSADNFAAGFVGTVFIAYLSSLTDPLNAATQYALLSSLYSLFCKTLAGFSGVISEYQDWENFFLLTAGYGLPALLLIALLAWRGPPAARGAG
ncbi:MAG: MFS transporter [Salinisphaeraceae bacterium]|nr:MFS transporter [Salinisphaeraceae bacterium]